MSAEPLVGRDRESGEISRLLKGMREGGGTLLIRGEAGIGKSALLDSAVHDVAPDTRVLSIAGVESETNLPFAALHQLLRPFLSQADVLPAPQRDALFAAFGRGRAAAAPDLFLVDLAALGLVTGAAAQTPLLLVADDAQWLDRPSAEVLVFVARRVRHDPIVVLVAARTEHECAVADVGLPELHLEPLAHGPAGQLLDATCPGLMSSARGRLLAEAAGNPLALLELPAVLDSRALDGEVLPQSRLPQRSAHGFAPSASKASRDARSGTRQELQIVQMAAEGLSNREIGLRLYLSHRTVESHLYRAFPKLGIATRAQLPAVLGDRGHSAG